MKIRNGFVSNSSSSSFIVVLDKNPMEIDAVELRKLLFGDATNLNTYDYTDSTTLLAETILADLQLEHKRGKRAENDYYYGVKSVQGKMSKEDLAENIACGYFDGHPDFSGNNYYYNTEDHKLEEEARKQGVEEPYRDPKWSELIQKACKKRYVEEEKMTNEAAAKVADPFWEEHKDKYIYLLEYSDNEGSLGCTLEHGGVFDFIPHIRISHH